jgi:hypothetical protein
MLYAKADSRIFQPIRIRAKSLSGIPTDSKQRFGEDLDLPPSSELFHAGMRTTRARTGNDHQAQTTALLTTTRRVYPPCSFFLKNEKIATDNPTTGIEKKKSKSKKHRRQTPIGSSPYRMSGWKN